MPQSAPRPLSIELVRTEALRIHWADGVISVYPLAGLRRACPCAGCRGERANAAQSALPIAAPIDKQRSMASAENVELVGHYAIRITWRDGHNTGIFDYELLRRLAGELESPTSAT